MEASLKDSERTLRNLSTVHLSLFGNTVCSYRQTKMMDKITECLQDTGVTYETEKLRTSDSAQG